MQRMSAWGYWRAAQVAPTATSTIHTLLRGGNQLVESQVAFTASSADPAALVSNIHTLLRVETQLVENQTVSPRSPLQPAALVSTIHTHLCGENQLFENYKMSYKSQVAVTASSACEQHSHPFMWLKKTS